MQCWLNIIWKYVSLPGKKR